MAARTLNMTQGKPASLIWRFAIPLMAGNIFQQLYTVVDTAVVGKALGVAALAAVGASDWVNWLMLGMIQGFTQGFGILMAQCFGAGQHHRLRKIVGNSVTLSALTAAVLVVIGLSGAEPLLRLLQTPEDILPDTLQYLHIMFWGVPIVMTYNLLACILRAMGDSNSPLYAMILAALTNIALDLLFVLVFHWGIPGAAIATLIAQLLSGIYCALRIRKTDFLRLKKQDLLPDIRLDGHLFLLGIPMAFQNAIIAIGGMMIQRVTNGFGVVFIAGFTATNKLYGILEVAATSFGYAMVTFAGQNLGAGQIGRIRKGIRSGNAIGFVTALVIAAFMLIFGKGILGLFISGTPQEVAEATKIGFEYLTVMTLCLPVLYYLHVTRSTVQGMGNTVLPMVSGIVEFIMRTAMVLILPGIMGYSGIFWAEVSAWAGADAVLAVSYLIIIRKISQNA